MGIFDKLKSLFTPEFVPADFILKELTRTWREEWNLKVVVEDQMVIASDGNYQLAAMMLGEPSLNRSQSGVWMCSPIIKLLDPMNPEGGVNCLSTGAGASPQAAISNAVHLWNYRILPPFLHSLFRFEGLSGTEVETWEEDQPQGAPDFTIISSSWAIGKIERNGDPKNGILPGTLRFYFPSIPTPTAQSSRDNPSSTPPENPFPSFLSIRDALLPHLPPNEIHWASLFISSESGKTTSADCFLNNVNRKPGIKTLMTQSLPKDCIAGLYWRTFLLFPKEARDLEERRQLFRDKIAFPWLQQLPVPEFSDMRSLEEIVACSAHVLARWQNESSEEIENLIVRMGVPQNIAAQIPSFTPIAFARVMLKEMNLHFEERFRLRHPENGEEVSRRLSDEPVYRASLQAAENPAAYELDPKVFKAAAMCSCEFRALNQLMLRGTNPDDIRFTEPTLLGTEKDYFLDTVKPINRS